MKKKLVICALGILCLCGCDNNKADFNYTNKEQIEKEILTNFEKISENANMLSSNPYDYINNEYYENIVSLGSDAVLVLESMYNNGELTGLNGYLSALAIQDITKCNLNEKYNLDWSTAKEFYELWENNNCSYKSN